MKVHSLVDNAPPLISVYSQINPVRSFPSCLFKIQFNVILTFAHKHSNLTGKY